MENNIDSQVTAVLNKAAIEIKNIYAGAAARAFAATTDMPSTSPVAVAPPATREPAAKRTAKKVARPAKAPAPVTRTTAARAPGEKRSPQEIAKLRERITGYIKKNPGKRVEEIGKALDLSTKDMNLTLNKLKKNNEVTTDGQKRAMTYTWNPAANAVAG